MHAIHSTPSKAEVMMCLAMAGLNRARAAQLAGVSRGHFFRLLRSYRVKAPKATTKLSACDVRDIRLLLEKHTQQEVAVMKGVHIMTIGQIARRETWYWLR